jgi:alpha-mannosidase
MGIISGEYRDRIKHWIRTLKEDFYTPLGDMEFEYYRTMDHMKLAEVRNQEFTPVETGHTWGNLYEYGWFRTRFTLPAEAQGQRIVVNLQPGGESTLFVNGKEFGTYRADWVKEPHHFLEDNFLTDNGREGEAYELYMEIYAGHYYAEAQDSGCATGPVLPGLFEDPAVEGHRRCLGASTYGIWDETAYQLYMDVMTLNGLLEVIDQDSLRAERIAEALETFTLLVDFEQDKEARTASYRVAREAIRPAMEAENGSSMPEFYCIGNAHLDLVWLWPLAETKRKTARTFAAQLRLLKEYDDYRFIQSQPACYEMCRESYPDLFEEIRQAILEGRWIAEGAMWVEPDTNMAGGEALIRQLLYGKRYYKEMFDVDSRLLWLPDTFGYTAALPQILKGCGVDYLVTQKIFWSYNEGEQFPYHYFNWRGMDGTEIVSFLPTSYTYGTNPAELNNVWKNRAQKRELYNFLIPFGYGDGGGGPTRDHIEYLERQKNLEGSVKMHMENPVDYFVAMDEMGGPANTYTGELYFTAHRGTYTSQAAIKKWNRKNELALRSLELWGSVALTKKKEDLLFGNSYVYPADKAEKLWKETLLNQFHDILPGSSIGRVYDEVRISMERAWNETAVLVREAAASMVCAGEGITVFNSLPFKRVCLTEVPESYDTGCRTLEGDMVPVYTENGRVTVFVEVPALGAVTVVPWNEEVRAEKPIVSLKQEQNGFLLENEKLRVYINAEGEITSYILKENGREFAKSPMNHFRLFKDVPRKFDAWDIDSNYAAQEIAGAFDVKAEIICGGGAKAVLHIEGRIGESTFTQDISLEAGGERVEFATEVDWREMHRLLKVSFPTTVYGEMAINEMQFGYVERPMHRSRTYDKDRFEVCNHRYSAVCDGGNGMALLNDCKYGISMEDGVLELTLLRAATCPEMRADNGIHNFTYGVTAWKGMFMESSVVRQGYEINEAPLVVAGLIERFSLAEVNCDHVVIDTVKLAEDGSGDLIFRLYECKKAMDRAVLTVNCLVRQAWICDMLENKLEETEVSGGNGCGSIRLDFRAFEIKTVRVSLKNK